ncbi:MAG: IS1595 family transposase [Xanthobacteraceae bacterium]
MSILSQPHFHSEVAAYARLEEIVWPNGPVCPHCGGVDRITPVKGGRIGLRRCGQCKGQFTCKVGTVFEDSKVPLRKWFQAAHLLASSKKGISSHQLHRTLGVTYKTAWFMSHRLREAMRDTGTDQIGGPGKMVEADETFFVNKKGFPKKKGGAGHKMVVVSLVEREGPVKSVIIDAVSRPDIEKIVKQNVHKESHLMTDEAKYYKVIGEGFAAHGSVVHSLGEYVKGDAHTNTLEGIFSIFKRGMKGVYQHCGEQHLHRYVAEFDFRYNNRVRLGVDDEARTARALRGIVGKRLTYRWPH